MKKFILVFAAVAALLMSCQTEEEKAGSLSGEGYQFNFTIAPGGFDSATKGDATVGWTVGEKVYVFFKPEGGELLDDSYAAFTYTGSGWNPESYVAPGALGSSGKMAAVYVPYFKGKSPVYTDSKWTFDSGDVYYSCASGADYTVNGGTVRGTLSMKIPDGYVQFSIASAAEGDELACNMIDGYEDVTLSSDLVFSTTPVSGSKMTGHADNGKTYFWGRVNGATATECEFTLTTSAGDVVLKVPAENVFKNNAFNIASSFAPALPAGALKGEFSVSATKKVHFSKGNLYHDGSALNFEASQNATASGWDASHVSLFTWSDNIASAVSTSNSGNNLFCDEDHKVSVDGSEAIYYALSKDEWTYLFSNHTKKWASVNGVNGYVIAPDGFEGTLADSYADDAALAADNLVFLPAAGNRYGSDVDFVGVLGDYWSSAANDEYSAYDVIFSGNSVSPDDVVSRTSGCSVRLVTDAAVSTVSVESVGLNKTATTIAAGATETLTATVLPETATDKSVTWSSSKESVATVDNTGKVTAVAAGEATITVTTTDGSKTATCTVTVTAALPTGTLKGEFSVSATKKVQFSKGNLYYDGSALNFEASQYAFNSSYESTHVSHFTWSSTVADAAGYANSSDNLFCDEDHKVSVNGSETIYYALSTEEWQYLFNNHSKKWAAVNGVGGYVIAPDGFAGTLADTYADDAALAAAGNLVFLPAAGFRDGFRIVDAGECGSYYSSSAFHDLAHNEFFNSNLVSPINYSSRDDGCSIRLVTDAAVSTVSVESVGLNKTATTIAAGATETLTATVLPETATDKSVTWSSSKESVATVDNTGKVTAVAAGEATITVTTTDGSKTATCTVTVTAALPTGALKGEFSVSATKKVHFSKGNLYYDGSALNFEANQYAFNSSYESSHVSHFTWSSTVEDAAGESSSGDNLFCDENHKVSVNGSEAIYYALSKDEWTYLFDNHSKKWATVNGVGGYVIAPDGFEGTLADSYADDAALAADNLVFLLAAGFRNGSIVRNVGDRGYYWSSSALDEDGAYGVNFNSSNVYPVYYVSHYDGCSVRLVTDVK